MVKKTKKEVFENASDDEGETTPTPTPVPEAEDRDRKDGNCDGTG